MHAVRDHAHAQAAGEAKPYVADRLVVWYIHGPGGIPQVIAIAKEPPPEGLGAVDYVTLQEGLNAGVLTPDTSWGAGKLAQVWEFISDL